MRSIARTVFWFSISLLLPSLSFSLGGQGPLYTRSIFLPYSLYYQNPGLQAAIDESDQWTLTNALYLTNDTVVALADNGKEVIIVQDYENLTLEQSLSHPLSKNLEWGASIRVSSFQGGFLDSLIESFHGTFGFPNGGRERIARDRMVIDVENRNGVNMERSGGIYSLSDSDTWLKFLLAEGETSVWSLVCALKIPTGVVSGSSILSTGYPDLGLTLCTDQRGGPWFSWYIQAGYTIPGECLDLSQGSRPYPFFTGLLSLEYRPSPRLSVVTQCTFKGSVMSSRITDDLFTGVDRMSLPQTDLSVGILTTIGSGLWQFSFTENPLTGMGADISFEIRRTARFKPRVIAPLKTIYPAPL